MRYLSYFNLNIVNFNINMLMIFCVESRTTNGKLRLFELKERKTLYAEHTKIISIPSIDIL
jgi:hypothetical protein